MPFNMRIRSAAAGCLFLHAETRILAQHITCAECSKQGFWGAHVVLDHCSEHACLSCWMQAEKRMLEANENKEYLPIDGLPAFKKATVQLLLGSSHPAIKDVSLPAKPCIDGPASQ